VRVDAAMFATARNQKSLGVIRSKQHSVKKSENKNTKRSIYMGFYTRRLVFALVLFVVVDYLFKLHKALCGRCSIGRRFTVSFFISSDGLDHITGTGRIGCLCSLQYICIYVEIVFRVPRESRTRIYF